MTAHVRSARLYNTSRGVYVKYTVGSTQLITLAPTKEIAQKWKREFMDKIKINLSGGFFNEIPHREHKPYRLEPQDTFL